MEQVYLGLDMGGTRTKLALVQKGGQLLKVENQDARSELSMGKRLDHLVEDIQRLLADEFTLEGIGIAFPGIVDHEKKKIVSKYVKYPDANKIDLEGWARQHWGVPLVLENDARAALLGEWQYGSGKGSANLLMVTLGTGMGTAALVNGQLLRGKNFLAGNLGGHMTIDFEGALCNCGNKGCLETVGSSWALASNFNKIAGYRESSLNEPGPLNFKKVFQEAAKNDQVAIELKNKSLEAWAAAVINLVHAYDPEKVILGGGIMESKDQIIPFIENRVRERSWLPDEGVPLVAAQHTRHAGILGVCYLLHELEEHR